MSVDRIEIEKGDVRLENNLSSRADVIIDGNGKDNEVFRVTDQQALELYEVLETYLKSRLTPVFGGENDG
jgi:hypothetical protein